MSASAPSNITHTPGPWNVDTGKESKGVIFIFAERTDLAVLYRQDVAIMLGRKSTSDDIVADARLMAAAPELLDACREAVVRMEQLSEADYQRLQADDLVFRLNDAIAKAILPAEGETNA